MNTPTLIPITIAPKIGEGSNIIFVRIAVPEAVAELFPKCYPAANRLAGIFLRDAVIAKLSLNPQDVYALGEINQFSLLIICETGPTAQAMNVIRDLLAENMTLESFTVISKYCASEGFFREHFRGEMATDITGMATFETLKEAIAAENLAQAKFTAEMKTTLTQVRERIASQASRTPPQA